LGRVTVPNGDVDRAELRPRRLHRCRDLRRIADVGRDADRAAAGGAYALHRGVHVRPPTRDDGHAATVSGERLAHGAADALAAAADDSHLAFDLQVHAWSLSWFASSAVVNNVSPPC